MTQNTPERKEISSVFPPFGLRGQVTYRDVIDLNFEVRVRTVSKMPVCVVDVCFKIPPRTNFHHRLPIMNESPKTS